MSAVDELEAAIAAHLRGARLKQSRHRDYSASRDAREAAIYARVSPLADDAARALDAQVAACQDAASSLGVSAPLIFADIAGGDTLDRPRLAELRAAIARDWVEMVLVTGLDRLARNPALLAALTVEWSATGVTIVAIERTS
jgi:site-specific DNA recombinase